MISSPASFFPKMLYSSEDTNKTMSQWFLQPILLFTCAFIITGSVPVFAGYEDQAYQTYDDTTSFFNNLVKGFNVETDQNPLGTTNVEIQDVSNKGTKTGKELMDLIFAFHDFIKSVIIATTPDGVAVQIIMVLAGGVSIYFLWKLAKGLGRHIVYTGIIIFVVFIGLLVIN
jgi:hypothetical protein